MPKPTDAPRPPGRPLQGDRPAVHANLSLPADVMDALREEARRTGRSMSRIVADAVRKALGGGQDE